MSIFRALDLSVLSPIFVLPTHLQTEDLHEAEDSVYRNSGQLSYHASEARIFLGRISQKRRAAYDLRARGLWTEESPVPAVQSPRKRVKIERTSSGLSSSSSTLEPTDEPAKTGGKRVHPVSVSTQGFPDLTDHIVVLKLGWLDDSIEQNKILPYQPYLIYSGKIVPKPPDETQPDVLLPDPIIYVKAHLDSQPGSEQSVVKGSTSSSLTTIVSRRNDGNATSQSHFHRRKFGRTNQSNSSAFSSPLKTHPRLMRTTTSEFENLDSRSLPTPPAWMSDAHPRPMYACLRSTPMHPVNSAFISQLYKIKEARLLTLDEIGVRAYSTSIASLAAYPHVITSAHEITRLPGCNDKIALLWSEWYDSASDDDSRSIETVRALENDTDLTHLKTFWNIWGVGAETARKFYFDHGWKDLDDVVEFGWTSLSRVQQIGVKFYDDFQIPIPRAEVESIADTILHHARLCKSIPPSHWSSPSGHWTKPDDGHGDTTWDPRDIVAVIVGGYRRGKAACGDVDIILSHRDEHLTKDLVVDVVRSLESAGWITHTLTLNTTTSDRNQQTLPFRATHAGHGFDSLDKALCVWQDPHFEGEKNTNVHRRVDIIVSAWRTVGAAVLGWSGATTFERDIRRWVKKEKGWKFDSSGVRDRGNGLVVDLETATDAGDGDGWEDRERRLMVGMGIGWRPATERCTG